MDMDTGMNPLQALASLGQSVWLDDLRRGWLDDGTIARMIAHDALTGLTSNPAIFEKAIAGGTEYEAPVRVLAREGASAGRIYESLATEDVRRAADLLRPAWDASGGRDGLVSLEVSPHLADDTAGTIDEARRLWRMLDRPNAMIKVPATAAGLPAICELVAQGVNVNVTLLFGLARYRTVVDSFLDGLERRVAAGEPPAGVTSVASFFVSRIDTLVDARLRALGGDEAIALCGQAAIASARLAHVHYSAWTRQPRWQRLGAAGALPQRLLWASTSAKDPAYPDTLYVEALVGAGTICTMPRATLEAYRDHGRPAARLDTGLGEARAAIRRLSALGIDLDAASDALEREGVRKFIEPFDRLHALLAHRAAGSRQ